MARTLQANVTGRIDWKHIDPSAISNPTDQGSLEAIQGFENGGGPEQVGDIFRANGTLAAAASVTIDLFGGETGVFGETVIISRLRTWMVQNLTETEGEDLSFGPAGVSNALGDLFNGDDDAEITIPAKGANTWTGPVDGITVDATNKNVKLTNRGTGDIDYKIVLIGVRWPEPEESSSSSANSSSSSTEDADYSTSTQIDDTGSAPA